MCLFYGVMGEVHEITTSRCPLFFDNLLRMPPTRLGEILAVEPGDLYFRGKYRRLTQPTSAFCQWVLRELEETATSLAERLGITQGGVSKSVLRGEKIVKEMNLKLLQN